MFAKILAIVVAFGAVGCVLLVNRQTQLENAHTVSRLHERLADHERTIWRLRAEIARQCSPDELREARDRLNLVWVPFVRDGAEQPFQRRRTHAAALEESAATGDESREDIGG